MSETFRVVLASVWGIYLVVLSIWIVLEKRTPQATIGWLLALAWLPVVGWVIYYFIGPRRLKRQRIRRDESRQVLTSYRNYLQEQIAKALNIYPHLGLDEHGLHIDKETYEQLAGMVGDGRLSHVITPNARQISHMIFAATGLPITIASHYELLDGGDATFDQIFQAIKQATHTVHLEYYIYEPDITGTALRDLLVDKLKEGVKVRLLVDWLGSRKITHKYMESFLAAGGELAFFHEGSLRQIKPLLNMRSHRKIVVCDGVIGFTGGVNITDEEDIRRHPKAYHDLHLKIEGPAVYWLDEVFLEDWHYTTGVILEDVSPPVPLEDVPIEMMQQVQVITSGPDTPQAPIWRAKLMAINSAKERVWLVSPYFVPDEPAVFALTTAALRGVDVRVMVPLMSDNLITTLAARSWYEELIEAGVRIWEYTPRMLHTKTLLVDEAFSFVGTDNFDNRSFRLNFEVTILNYEKSGARALEEQFEKDMLNAKELTMADMNIPWWQKLPEDIARLGAPLL